MKDLLEQLEAAVLRRNPGYADALQPPLEPEVVRDQLKRVGLKENVEPIIAWYAWHNGARFGKECAASRLGLAPPVISAPDPKNIAFLESLGHKVTAPQQICDTIAFHDFQGGLSSVKLWRKFARTIPARAVLCGRFFPILLRTNAGDAVAVDVSAEGNGRVAMIMHDQQVRDAYSSFPSFLRDLIRANESNELLACLQTPGPVLELKALVPAEPPQPRAARNSPALPVGDKALVVRTDFSDDAAWVALRAKLQHAEADSAADVEFVDDRALAGVTAEQFRSLLPPGRHVSFGFLADRAAMAEPDHPILAVGLSKRKSKTFRVAAAALGEVEGNLSLGNMDFAEFLKALDADGVFRGAASESGPQ